MASLDNKDLDKTAKTGPYANMSRADIFRQKIKDKSDFIIGTTITGKKVKGVSFDENAKVLYWINSQKKTGVAKVSTIFKDSDFGGGSAGSGGGAKLTEIVECLQCYYCAYIFNMPTSKIKTISDAQLKSVSQFCDTSKTLEFCLKECPQDWRNDKVDIFAKIANKLYADFGSKTQGKVYFHRGSKFMNKIYAAKKACHDNDKKSFDTQAPGSFSNDKWNPGDIWMSTFPITDNPLKDSTSTWGELNTKIAQLAGAYAPSDRTKLLGISLKKLTGNAVLREYKKPGRNDVDEYTFKGFKFGKTGDFFRSQDIYFETSADEIQFRTFNETVSWQGEIKGKSAAAGKIGGGNVDFYCNQVLGKKFLPTTGEDALFKETKNADFPKVLYDLYKKHNGGQISSSVLLSFEDFMKKYEKTTTAWRNSKIVCMKFLDVFDSASKAKKDELVNKLYLYGSSDTEQSSYFIKIY